MKGTRTKLQGWALRVTTAWALLALLVSAAHAQHDDTATAARAFQSGQKAQLSGDFARAAELFELADTLSPTPEALRSTMRNQEAAGHPARAATSALDAKARYPEDEATIALANEILSRVALRLSRVTIRCDESCSLLVDGEALTVEPVASADVFLHRVRTRFEARFGTEQHAAATLELLEGDYRELELREPEESLTLEAPPLAPAIEQPAEPAIIVHRPNVHRAPPVAVAPSDRSLPPWLALSAGALAVTCGAAALVSGLDALDKADAYEAEPTRQGYERGVDSERRTNALLVAAGGLAVTSAVLLFTAWNGEEDRRRTAKSPFHPRTHVGFRSYLP